MFSIAVAFAKWVLRDYLAGLEELKDQYKEADRQSSQNFANAVMEISNLQTDLSLLASSKSDLLDILNNRNKTIDALRSAIEDHQRELTELRKTVVRQEETNQLSVNEVGLLRKDNENLSKALSAAQSLVEDQHQKIESLEDRLQKLCKCVDKQISAIRFSVDAAKMCNKEQPDVAEYIFQNRFQEKQATGEHLTTENLEDSGEIKVGDWIEWRWGGQWVRSEGPVTVIRNGKVMWTGEDGSTNALNLPECRRTTPPETESHACCENEDRGFSGGCKNCGDPAL